MSRIHEAIDYVEFPATDIAATKAFFEQAFGWVFTDFGPEYTAFNRLDRNGIEGGFYKSPLRSNADEGAALLIFYSDNLEETELKIMRCGGLITKAIFAFPGGRRFHFTCPSGNEFAVWSEA